MLFRSIVYLKQVNFMVYSVYLNKAIFSKKNHYGCFMEKNQESVVPGRKSKEIFPREGGDQLSQMLLIGQVIRRLRIDIRYNNMER